MTAAATVLEMDRGRDLGTLSAGELPPGALDIADGLWGLLRPLPDSFAVGFLLDLFDWMRDAMVLPPSERPAHIEPLRRDLEPAELVEAVDAARHSTPDVALLSALVALGAVEPDGSEPGAAIRRALGQARQAVPANADEAQRYEAELDAPARIELQRLQRLARLGEAAEVDADPALSADIEEADALLLSMHERKAALAADRIVGFAIGAGSEHPLRTTRKALRLLSRRQRTRALELLRERAERSRRRA